MWINATYICEINHISRPYLFIRYNFFYDDFTYNILFKSDFVFKKPKSYMLNYTIYTFLFMVIKENIIAL